MKNHMTILDFLRMQRQLQIDMKEANPTQTGDPMEMDREQLAWFITWNHTALVRELGEALDETGWKPWATSRHCNDPAAYREMVDAFHFFLNILLAIASWSNLTVDEIGEQFEKYYIEKNRKNLLRQVGGYDGVSTKCAAPGCRRELSETPRLHHITYRTIKGPTLQFCSTNCCDIYVKEKETHA